MRKIKPGWNNKRMGVQLGTSDQTRLSNLRFADDVLIIAKSQRQITTMLTDLHRTASQFGLQLHPEKTQILTNTTKKTGRGAATKVDVDDMSVSILPLSGSVKYLGRKLTFENSQEVELQNRIRAGWAKFMASKQELTGKYYSLNSRLKLFDALVSPTVLYAAGTWTLTKQQEHKLIVTQRRMLRMILGAGRRQQQPANEQSEDTCGVSSDDVASNVEASPPTESMDEEDGLEPWSEWIHRVTHRIEDLASKINIQNWVLKTRILKWRLASRVANKSPDRWPARVLNWNPHLIFEGNRSRAQRKQARPKLRWLDDIQQCVRQNHPSLSWDALAHDTDAWDECGELFCNGDWRQPRPGNQLHSVRVMRNRVWS